MELFYFVKKKGMKEGERGSEKLPSRLECAFRGDKAPSGAGRGSCATTIEFIQLINNLVSPIQASSSRLSSIYLFKSLEYQFFFQLD